MLGHPGHETHLTGDFVLGSTSLRMKVVVTEVLGVFGTVPEVYTRRTNRLIGYVLRVSTPKTT